MAFGFGFNKQKVLSAAEKFVQQGKLPNAISEYEKILKADSKDLTVMNTVGDLHSRLGETEKAAECFKSVGDAYASQGFTVKAIAMYKKLSKLKSSMECVLRLAELYTQQGLFNDARAQYLLVAEEFLKTGQLDQAVRIFEKTLEMDPDNVAMRTKLAEVYVRLGKKPEAWQILTAAAETLRAKGQLAAADEILQRMLKLEPGNSYALVLRGKAALEAGDAAAAIETLTKIADLDTNPEGLRILFQAYLRAKRFTDAGSLAIKLANVHDDIKAVDEYADALVAAQQYREALQIFEQFCDRLLRNDSAKLVEAIQSLIGHLRDDPQALEIVLGLFQNAGESTHLTEVYELLAHGYVQTGDLEKAREYYLKLTQLEPANQIHAQNYQQVLEKQGTTTKAALPITAEEGTALVDELEATAPFVEQRYDDEVALAVRAALTDAELFISYNMPAKALAPLISALPKAPRNLQLNQKLAALHTRAGRFTEAGVCCRTLESIYHDAGHADEASRYADLAAKYEASCGTATPSAPHEAAVDSAVSAAAVMHEFEVSGPSHESVADASEAVPVVDCLVAAPAIPKGLFFHASTVVPAVPAASNTVAARAQQVSEVDLSNEWEQDLHVEAPQVGKLSVEEVVTEGKQANANERSAAAQPAAEPGVSNLDESIEEVRFYLGQGMNEQAEQVLAGLEAVAPEIADVAVLRLAVESAKQAIAPAAEGSIDEPCAVEEQTVPASSRQPWPQERPVLQEMVSEIEESLGDGFLADPQEGAAPEAEPETLNAGNSEFRSGSLDDFVSDLEASLGGDFVPATAVEAAPAAAPAISAAPFAHTGARVDRAEAPAAMAAAAGAIPAKLPSAAMQQSLAPAASLPVQSSNPATIMAPSAGIDLSDMFGELKLELESGVTGVDEDPETHYNLGVAFREMGLLDEAIGELQKVIQAVEHGRPFPQMIQTYTWLAQCFLDKGVPEAAVRWYEKALQLPSLDQETKTALHYELGASLETAGNKPAALKNFLEAYSSNIDYRDVAERIQALRP